MENTPSRIAADLLMSALEAKTLRIVVTPENIAAAFTVIHQAVFEAAKKDKEDNLFNVYNK